MRLSKSGGAPTTLWSGDFVPNGAAVDTSSVYFDGGSFGVAVVEAVAKR